MSLEEAYEKVYKDYQKAYEKIVVNSTKDGWPYEMETTDRILEEDNNTPVNKIITKGFMGKILDNKDNVNSPPHYNMEGIKEVIDVIRHSLTKEEFIGYCKGNILKYHLRSKYKGKKEEDTLKACKHAEWLKNEI